MSAIGDVAVAPAMGDVVIQTSPGCWEGFTETVVQWSTTAWDGTCTFFVAVGDWVAQTWQAITDFAKPYIESAGEFYNENTCWVWTAVALVAATALATFAIIWGCASCRKTEAAPATPAAAPAATATATATVTEGEPAAAPAAAAPAPATPETAPVGAGTAPGHTVLHDAGAAPAPATPEAAPAAPAPEAAPAAPAAEVAA